MTSFDASALTTDPVGLDFLKAVLARDPDSDQRGPTGWAVGLSGPTWSVLAPPAGRADLADEGRTREPA